MTHPWQPSIPPEWPAPAFPADPRPPFAPPARPLPSYFVPVGPDPVSERLYEQRIVLAHGELTPERATAWCAQLLTLGAIGREPITLHLSIPDGELGATLTLLDTLDSLTVEVTAVVAGRLGGPPVGLLTAVTHRQATPNSVLRLGEPRLAAVGTAEEVAAADEQGRRMLEALYRRLAELTGRDVEQIRADARAGRILSAEEAVEYGLVESVSRPRRP